MASRRRWPWILLAAAVLAVLVAVVVLPRLLDVERYRGRIEQALRESTGWEPELGRMDFSVLRGLVLRVSPVRLAAAGGGSSVDVEALEIRADLRPLLGGRLVIRSVDLRRPRIELLRRTADEGWVIPVPVVPPEPDAPAESPDAAGGGFDLTVEEVRAGGGSLHVEDRTFEPPLVLDVEDVEIVVYPDRKEMDGSAVLAGEHGGGRLRWMGSSAGGTRIAFDGVATAALAPFVGAGVLQPGGKLSGEVEIDFPLRVQGRMRGEQILLLAGDRPLEWADIGIEISAAGDGLRLQKLEIDTEGAKIHGSGELTPDLDVTLEIPSAPLEPVIRLARAAFPPPLELEPPGSARATIRVQAPQGGELSYRADCEISAANFRVAEVLPPAENVRASIVLSPAGAVEVRILEATMAGGPLTGSAHIDSIEPLAPLRFEGDLARATLGALLEGFIAGAGQRVGGATGLQARVAVDLGAKELDARALAGSLSFDSKDVRLPGWDLERAIGDQLRERLGALGKLAERLDPAAARKLDAAAREEPTAGQELLDGISATVDLNALPWKLDRFELRAGGLTASGGGTFDPVAGDVDLRFAARLDAARTAELVRRTPQLEMLVGDQRQLTLPLHLEGSLLAPKIGVDTNSLTEEKLGGQKPKEALKGLLKGLIDKKR